MNPSVFFCIPILPWLRLVVFTLGSSRPLLFWGGGIQSLILVRLLPIVFVLSLPLLVTFVIAAIAIVTLLCPVFLGLSVVRSAICIIAWVYEMQGGKQSYILLWERHFPMTNYFRKRTSSLRSFWDKLYHSTFRMLSPFNALFQERNILSPRMSSAWPSKTK